MSAKREELAKAIVREYHANGIPAKVYHGMVLIQRHGELAGPFEAELLASELRAEIESIKKHVLSKLESYGIIEVLKSFKKNHRACMFDLLTNSDYGDTSFFFSDVEDLARHAQGILADADFLANPFYWNVARIVVQELDEQYGSAEDPPE